MTLRDICANFNDDESMNWIYIGDFLDEYRFTESSKLKFEMLKDEPCWTDQSEYIKTFISAMATKLAVDCDMDPPMWVYDEKYFKLWPPHFAMNAKGDLRIVLLAESPKEFRERNIFTTENVLNRV